MGLYTTTEQAAAPSSPASGSNTLYPKTDTYWYWKDSAGTEHQILASSVPISSLTASQAVFTDASKNLVSNPISGSGNVAMTANPVFTGTLTATAALATSLRSGPAIANTGGINTLATNAVTGAPVSSGTTQTNGVFRLGSSATSGIIDFGMDSSTPWIQATDHSDLSQTYTLQLNPRGGTVAVGGALTAGATSVTTLSATGLITSRAASLGAAINITNTSLSGKNWDFLPVTNSGESDFHFYYEGASPGTKFILGYDGRLVVGTSGTGAITAGATSVTTLAASTSIATGTGTTTTAGLKLINGSAGAASGYGSLYPENVTPSGTNYALAVATNAGLTVLNSLTAIDLRTANSTVVGITSTGASVTGTLDGTTTFKTGGYTVGTLPANAVGTFAYVTDQLTTVNARGAAPTGGGAVVCYQMNTGAGWVGM